ncbi:MAG TPA: MiaB/RimO family radical SAM methylthiotransferase [Tepidisphaeraceae bacterium]|nr:MiaB/RimO family radical SAM methylthiotransferase [Tepidisphaeraceae bacterium]
MPRLYLETFGCQMNVLDSELVLGQLRAQGYESTDDRTDADIIVYNTCSVREHAEQKVWSRLGELRETKKERPDLVIGVIGCMAERDGTDIFRKFPHVDILCGPGELDKLPGMIHNAVVQQVGRFYAEQTPVPTRRRQTALMGSTTRRSSTLAAAEDNLELLDLSRAVSPSDDLAQAYVRITRGCNKFCTYCVVPYTRGPEVHRPPQNIIDEVKMLADAGVKEVTLLGQTINHYAYQHTDGSRTSFGELLYRVHEAVPHLARLRFVTSYPRDFTDEALQAMRDCERICRYLHVPAQHGNNRVLKLMNRGYTVEEYLDFIERARGYMPDVSLASDFIVGFPTETDAEFEQTAELVKSVRFKNSFIFKYSPRPGTVAIKRHDDDVPDDVKRRRNNVLLAVQSAVSEQNNLEMVGKTVDLMVEGASKLVSRQKAYPASQVELGGGFGPGKRAAGEEAWSEETMQLVGRTRGDQVVVFDGPISLKGQLVDVEITSATKMTLFGRACDPVISA